VQKSMTLALTSELLRISAQCQKSSTVTEKLGCRSHRMMNDASVIDLLHAVFCS